MPDYWKLATFGLGVIGLAITILHTVFKKRRKPGLDEIFMSFLAFTSIPPGVKICWVALTSNVIDQLQVDWIYIFAGGLAVLWLAGDAVYAIVKKP